MKVEVSRAGILDRSYFYYFALILFAYGGFFLSLVGVYFANSFLPLLLATLCLTAFFVQIGGLIHDSGHRAIFNTPRANDFLGYIFAGTILTVYDSWKTTHNAHHANPNKIEEDPDMEIPFITYDLVGYQRKSRLEKLLIEYQAYLYYPILSMAAVSLRIGRIAYYKNFRVDMWWHLLIYILGFAFWFIVPFFVFDFGKALFSIALANFTMGIYMSNIFAPNHKGMPEVKAGTKLSFLEQQILTARNVRGGFLTDFLLLGLNYQTEHHLFPNCPRNKLKLITPYVKKVCRQLNLQYTEVSFVKSNKIILSELNSVSLSV